MLSRRHRSFVFLAVLAALLVASVAQFPAPIKGQSTVGSQSDKVALASSSNQVAAQPASQSGDKGQQNYNFPQRNQEEWQRLTYPGGYLPAQAVPNALAWRAQHNPESLPAGLSGMPANKTIHPNSPLALVPGQWTSLGPAPIASVDPDHNLNAGRVTSLAVDPTSAAIVYAGMANGGIWKSINCCGTGTAFTPLNNDPNVSTAAIGSLAIDPNDHNTVYAGTGEANGSDSLSGRGILKSTDGGQTWSNLGLSVFDPVSNASVNPISIGSLVIDPRNSMKVVAGAAGAHYADTGGLYVSDDAGNNWTNACTLPGGGASHDIRDMTLDSSANPTTIYVAVGVSSGSADNGIYKGILSGTGCPTLIKVSTVNWPAPTALGRIALGLAPSSPNTIFAIVGTPTQPSTTLGIWRTSDGGVSWTQVSDGSGFTKCGGVPNNTGQDDYDLYLSVSPTDPNTFYVGKVDIYKGIYNGSTTTFTNLTNSFPPAPPCYSGVHSDEHAFKFLVNSSSYIVGGDGGLWASSNDGSSFTDLNAGLNTLQFYAGDITPNFASDSSPRASGGTQDNGNEVYRGEQPNPQIWSQVIYGDGFFTAIEPNQRQNYYAEYVKGELYCSNDSGNNFDLCYSPWMTATDYTGFSAPFILDHNHCGATCQHLVLGTYRAWETTDGGTSWNPISGSLVKNPSPFNVISALAFAPSSGTTLYSGSTDGSVFYSGNVGSGGAATFVDLTGSNAVLPNRGITDLAVDPTNPLIAYAALDGFDQYVPATPGHLYQVTCTAGCASFTWVNKSGNLPNIPTQAVAVNPLNPTQVFVGTGIGFFYTNDITASPPTWNSFQAGLPVAQINRLVIDRGSTALVAFTHGRSAYAIPLPGFPGGSTPTPAPPSPTPPCPIPFTDIQGNIFYQAITYLYCHGAVNGTSGTTYGPAGTSTRAQFAKVVVLGFGISLYTPDGGTQDFTDVAPSYFAYAFIETGFHAGILNGFDANTCTSSGATFPCYIPNRPITRGQITKLVVNAAHYTLVTPGTQTFSDVPPSNVFYIAIETAHAKGVINGYPDGTFRPNDAIRRDQMAQIVYKGVTTP